VNLDDPDVARREAARILRGRDFHPHHPPRPLHGVLDWIGRRFEPVTRWLTDVGRWFADQRALAIVASLVVIALALLVGTLVVRRRTLAVLAGDDLRRGRGGREDPDRLERAADEAERRGDHETALRLRFHAGLLRLDRAGVLRYRASLTSGAVMRQVTSSSLAVLAATHDEVVYGDRPASSADVDEARQAWPAVLQEARAR
jgi:hypothetical protein